LGPVEVREFVRLLADELVGELPERGAVVESVIVHGSATEPSSVDLAVLAEREAMTDLLGTHALLHQSPRRGRRSRKRWYAAVSCVEAPLVTAIEVDMRDVVFETCRAGGAGGQHINKTESAVRALHAPSGLSVRVESERSQLQNKRRAVAALADMLNRMRFTSGCSWSTVASSD
jgi:protein subunit release factor B